MIQKNRKQKINIVIVGVGGQGLITLARLIAEAALIAGFEVRTSELHGLSQREGSVKVDVRIGYKVFSPLVERGQADLVLAVEMQEALNAIFYSNKDTVFLVNKKHTPVFGKSFNEEEVLKILRQSVNQLELIDASSISVKNYSKEIFAGMILLKRALEMDLLPFKRNHLEKAIKKLFQGKTKETNLSIMKK